MRRSGYLVSFLLFLVVPVLRAQRGAAELDPTRVYVSREQLSALLTRLTRAAESPAYSDSLKSRVRTEAAAVKARLEDGDFQVGDRVWVSVESESSLTDTLTVGPRQTILLPGMGEIELKGVLRSELQPHVTAAIARYIREPRVRTRSFLRLAIDGAVSRPGFYLVPSEALVSDALMLAGGPAAGSNLQDARLQRGQETLLSGRALQTAVMSGRTLDQLNVRAGDRIYLAPPSGGLSGMFAPLRALSILLGIPFAIIALANLF